MTERIIISVLILSMAGTGIAQRSADDAVEKARELRKHFENSTIALTESVSTYRFLIEPKNGLVKVENQEKKQYISLRANAEYIIRNYYDESSAIDSYQLLNSKGRNHTHSKYCGHYQMDNIFHSDARLCAYSVKMPLAGERIDYSTIKTYNDPKYLTKIFIHENVPIEKRRVTFEIPDNINVELLEMNFSGYDIKKIEEKTSTGKSYVYEIDLIDEIPTEQNIPGYLHFMPHILVLTRSYQHNGTTINLISSTDDLYQWYFSLTRKLVNEPGKLVEKVQELVVGISDDEEKIKRIYYWVQDNIKYIAFMEGLAGFKPEDAHKVFYNRYGDCKGMANLMKEMLIIAGFDARLTWIGTNIIPYTYDIPSLAVDNHMIVTVFQDKKKYILDPTEKYQSMHGYAERIQGREILIENGESYIREKVPEEPLNKYLEEKNITYTLADNAFNMEGTANYNGEPLKVLLSRIKSLAEDKIDLFLRNIISGSGNSNNFTVQNKLGFDRDKPLKLEFQGKMNNQLNTFGNDIYLSMEYEKDFKDLKIEDKRKVPFDFGRKIYRTTVAEFNIPNGYKLQHAPQPLLINDGDYQFELRYEIKENQIKYIKEIKISKTTIPVSEFEKWNNIINQLNNFYNDQIILQAVH
jgi:hypothetical protein